MRYIRTKDGIYEINWFDADNFGDEKGDIHSNCEIISEADTIEELCECLVVRNRAINRRFIYSKDGFRKRVKRNKTNKWGRDNYEDRLKYLLEYNDVYGAIWCEWGLKYVARMNSNGEFELL